MALDPRFVVTQDLDSYFVDKDTGLPLAGGILTFYEDEARTVLKDVYTLTGAPPYSESSYVPLPNPIILSSVGTVQDAGGNNVPIYYFPYQGDQFSSSGAVELYYVTVTDSAGEEQFTREAWPNPQQEIGPAPLVPAQNFTENQLSNPNFTNVFLNGGSNTFTVTAAAMQVFPLGPDWNFIISGTGTVIVQQIAIAGASNIPSSPPYVLDIAVSPGITQCYLQQTFPVNSGLWASTSAQSIFLSGSFVAQNQAGGTVPVPMYYVPSSGGSPILIFTGEVTPVYQFLSGGTAGSIPDSSDSNIGAAGSVSIYLSFPAASDVRVSAIQVVPSLTAFSTAIAPDLNSSNRDEAYQADYYLPRAVLKQIDSFLVGWDFQTNPYQLGTANFNLSATPKYVADQTIATSNSPSTIICTPSVAPLEGIRFANTVGTGAFYILQYLSGTQVQDMLGTSLSVNVFGYTTTSAGSNTATMNVYLFTAPGTSSIPPLATPLGTLGTNGVFTPTAAGWIPVPRNGLPTASASEPTASAVLNSVPSASAFMNGNSNDYGFSGWQITDTTTNYFAIVVTFVVQQSTSVYLNSISVVPGDLPCRPSVKSPDEVLRQCQVYYQKSFIGSAIPIPASPPGINSGESVGTQAAASGTACTGPVIRFPVTLRTNPNPSTGVLLYNPVTPSSSQVRDPTTSNDWTTCLPIYVNAQGFVASGTTPVTSAPGNACSVHWTADARYGIV